MKEVHLYDVMCVVFNDEYGIPAHRAVAAASEVDARILAIENIRDTFPDREIEVNSITRTMIRVVVE